MHLVGVSQRENPCKGLKPTDPQARWTRSRSLQASRTLIGVRTDSSAPLVLVVGMPTVFAAVEAAGYRVHPGSDEAETNLLAQLGRGIVQRNGSYVVISRPPDRQTRMWLSLVSSQHVPVVVLADGTGTDTGLPASIPVLDLPVTLNEIVQAIGLPPTTRPIDTASIGADLSSASTPRAGPPRSARHAPPPHRSQLPSLLLRPSLRSSLAGPAGRHAAARHAAARHTCPAPARRPRRRAADGADRRTRRGLR